MPLDDREQKILDEIERQFYEQDPKLAETVARTSLATHGKRWQRLAVVGFVVGLVVMLLSFTSQSVVALGGFVVMVVSAGWIAMNLRRTRASEASPTLETFFDRARQRWRRDG
jgi:hypothetical protein